MDDSETTIRLAFAEATVLDNILRRYSETDKLTAEDIAEKRALWNLQCVFEKAGDRPLWPSLDDAKSALTDSAS